MTISGVWPGKRRMWVRIIVLATTFPLSLFGQSVGNAPPGSAISVPVPDQKGVDPEKYEIPELAGAKQANGSQLVNGSLPRPWVDYVSRVQGFRQRISIFQNGLVMIDIDGATGRIQKRMLLPEDALTNYRRHLNPETLAVIPDQLMDSNPTEDLGLLRIYDQNGVPVERQFSPSMVLPQGIERKRIILNDLLRAMSEDREVTNPLAGYQAKLGDRLLGEDQKMYEVTRLINDGEVLELTCMREPVKMYVSGKDIHNFFLAARPAADDED